MFLSLTLLSTKERVLSLFGRVYVSLSSTAPLSETTELFLKGVLLNSNIPPIENIFSIGGILLFNSTPFRNNSVVSERGAVEDKDT